MLRNMAIALEHAYCTYNTKPKRPKSAHCSAINCNNSRQHTPQFSFFKFPKEKERCRRWVVNTRRQDLLERVKKNPEESAKLHVSNVLCAQHFEQDQFQTSLQNSLKKDALPTIFNIPDSSDLVISKGGQRKKMVAQESLDFDEILGQDNSKCADNVEVKEELAEHDGWTDTLAEETHTAGNISSDGYMQELNYAHADTPITSSYENPHFKLNGNIPAFNSQCNQASPSTLQCLRASLLSGQLDRTAAGENMKYVSPETQNSLLDMRLVKTEPADSFVNPDEDIVDMNLTVSFWDTSQTGQSARTVSCENMKSLSSGSQNSSLDMSFVRTEPMESLTNSNMDMVDTHLTLTVSSEDTSLSGHQSDSTVVSDSVKPVSLETQNSALDLSVVKSEPVDSLTNPDEDMVDMNLTVSFGGRS